MLPRPRRTHQLLWAWEGNPANETGAIERVPRWPAKSINAACQSRTNWRASAYIVFDKNHAISQSIRLGLDNPPRAVNLKSAILSFEHLPEVIDPQALAQLAAENPQVKQRVFDGVETLAK
jgi:hypothetical protein